MWKFDDLPQRSRKKPPIEIRRSVMSSVSVACLARSGQKCRERWQALIQDEQIQASRPSEQHVLFAVEHEGLGGTRQSADLRIPQALPGSRVPGLDVLAVAQEQQAARGRQETGAAAVDLFPPRDLARLVVDGDDVRAPRQVGAAEVPPSPIDPRGSGSIR